VVGKDGNTAIGLIGMGTQGGDDRRNAMVFRLQRDFGLFSNSGLSFIGDNSAGLPSNRVLRLFSTWGAATTGNWRWDVRGQHTQTWQTDRTTGHDNALALRWRGTRPGMPNIRVSYDEQSPDFVSNLGLLSDLNRRGVSLSAWQFNQFDRGAIENYEWDIDASQYDRLDGTGFFRNDISFFSRVQNRRGFAATLFTTTGRRRNDPAGETFHDRQVEPGIRWNQRTLFSQGGVSYAMGRQAGEKYGFLNATQGIPINRAISMNLNFARQELGAESTSQFILTGTYRLSDLQTVSARLVRQDDSGNPDNVGATRGSNLYFAYARRERHGADFFLLLGDPNEATTKAQITVKVLRPY
jgi:hypothetical protein